VQKLIQVGHPVAIRIVPGVRAIPRIKPVPDFPSIGHAVAVAVGVEGIGAQCRFHLIRQPVAVSVRERSGGDQHKDGVAGAGRIRQYGGGD